MSSPPAGDKTSGQPRSSIAHTAINGQINKHFQIPNLLTPIFTGQDNVLRHLEKSFTLARTTRHPVQKRFVLYGEGGSGKTQICLKYAQTHRKRYWGVFWIDASSIENIHRSFSRIASFLDIDPSTDNIKRKFVTTTEPWMLIFDNFDNPKLSLDQFFPPCQHGDIIIISRNLTSCKYNSAGCHELGQMSPIDAEALLMKIVYGSGQVEGKNKVQTQKLVNAMARLAMAIAQAGTYIRETSCTFEKYIELYQQAREEVLESSNRNTEGFQRIVFTTCQVAVNMIKSAEDPISKSALKLLNLLCFYHHDNIPITMLYGAWRTMEAMEDSNTTSWEPWPEFVSGFDDLQQSIQASVTFLESFSLINCDSNTSLSLHPLVHNWCRNKLTENEQRSACRQSLKLISRSIEWSMEARNKGFHQSISAHVQDCLQFYYQQNENLDTNMTTEWIAIAMNIAETGATQTAIRMLEEVVNIRMSMLGGDHPDTLLAKHNLAHQYARAERLDEALRLEEQVVISRAKILGEIHPATLTSEYNLAMYYGKKGDLSKALQLEEHVVHLRANALGPGHLDTLQSLHSLAIRFSQVGRQAEAIRLIEQLVAANTKSVGEDHPDTLELKHELMSYYGQAGLLYDTLQLGQQVVTTRAAVLGQDHSDTLRSMQNLATWYAEAGQADEALRLCQHVVVVRNRKLGADHPDTVKSMALFKSLTGTTKIASPTRNSIIESPRLNAETLPEIPASPSRRRISRVWERVR